MAKTQDYPTSMTAVPGALEIKVIPQPPESAFKGRYRNRKDGFLYSHTTFDHPDGKTHKARTPVQYQKDEKGNQVNDEKGNAIIIHTGLFWEGTKEEFRETFDKE
jgi:hypothetical protein